ncbi:MAG: PHP domain-containing protein [Lachnospiraceae bacterium]|nr:PHP domain-containing protein [Lachnospiraceae bacterium]
MGNTEVKGYKYEVHMHTAQSSACGKTPGADYIAEFKRLGYDGMIITDHFYHGNTRPSRDLPWEDYVEEFCKGYEAAKAEGDRQGVRVFFGWEENHHGDEYLIYGPDKEWLKKHPEIRDADQTEYLKLIHEAGGLVVQAHPFRERGYMNLINIHPFQCDAMEACNFGNPPYQDTFAYNFCKDRGIIMTSGTDLHDVKNLELSGAGMVFEKPLESIFDYVRAVKSGKGFKPLIPEERKQLDPASRNLLPMILYDRDNKGRDIVLSDIFEVYRT